MYTCNIQWDMRDKEWPKVSQMDSGPPIPHTCVKYCQIPSCRGFSSQPNVGFFVSTFDILWLPDLTKSQPRYSCCSGSSKVFQCHGLPWTELEGDGTREVDQVSFGRKSTISFGATVMLHVLENIYTDLTASRKETMLKKTSVHSICSNISYMEHLGYSPGM